MLYIEGFVAAVPTANKDAYIRHAAQAVPLFREFGVNRAVETWGDDVPDGKITDFRRAVKATADEAVIFSWFEYRSREARDSANTKLMSDPRMQALGETMPFDAKRMIFGGFSAFVDEAAGGDMGYTDGYLVPVSPTNRDAYRGLAEKRAAVFRDYGATRVVEAWGDDIPDGKVTDFRRAVQAGADELIVFSWVEWPSREARETAWPQLVKDERLQSQGEIPFEAQRMIYGGFAPVIDE